MSEQDPKEITKIDKVVRFEIIELDDIALDAVIGGVVAPGGESNTNCGSTACDTDINCKFSCGS